MKILFSPCHYIYDEKNGGSEQSWAFNIAHRVSGLYPGSVVVTGFKNFPEEKRYQIIELQKGKAKLDMSLKNALKFNWQYFSATKRIIDSNSFDVLHHVLPFAIDSTFNLFVLSKRKESVPVVIGPLQAPLTYKDLDVNLSDVRNFQVGASRAYVMEGIYKIFKSILRILSRKTLKKSDKIIVINQYTKELLQRNGTEEKKITIIPPGIDTEAFKYCPFEQKEKNKTEFLVVCYLIKRKDVVSVIRAVSEVVKINSRFILRIIGDGPQREILERLAKELGVSQYVIFEGFIPNSDVQKYYQKAHVFISMSLSESWGQMYLEAMACGLPVISSKNVGSESMIHNGKFGYLVEQEDVKALAERMVYLIESPETVASFGKKARQEVEEKYDWDKVIIPRYLELYNEMKK